MKRVLTDAKVKNLKPKDKAYKVTDGGGLYVYVTKAGARSFRYDCKLHDKRFTLTFGTYPELSLSDAREMHEQARSALAKGNDPREASQHDELLHKPFSYYAQETLSALELRPSTEYKRINRMKRHLYPILDKKPVTDITAIDLLNLLKPLADEGKRETARLLATYCKQTFNTLVKLHLIPINPASGLNELLPKAKQSSNFAHITDTKQFAKLLKMIDSYSGDFSVGKALQFAPLAMLRPHNIRFLKWDYVDLKEKLITIPEEEMKMNRPHKVPLSDQALKIINEMKQVTGDCEYVFLSTTGQRTGKPMSENTLNQALIRVKDPKTGELLGRGTMTSHGFRHTASTLLNEMGYDADAIELQLAHASADRIRATYNKAELMPQRIEMMQAWADHLDGLKQGADVISIKRNA